LEITHQILDIAQYEANHWQPATVLDRKPAEKWLVRDLPVGITDKPTKEWGWVLDGPHVRIPLYPYLSNGSSPAVAIAFACELAFRIISMIGKSVDVKQVHIAIGDPVQEVEIPSAETPVLRFWLGFGFVIRE
jgi:hypothetical protein